MAMSVVVAIDVVRCAPASSVKRVAVLGNVRVHRDGEAHNLLPNLQNAPRLPAMVSFSPASLYHTCPNTPQLLPAS
jgi:hypothetical protein